MTTEIEELDPTYEPPNEWFTPNRTLDHGYISLPTRAEWGYRVTNGNIELPPPPWWLDAQDAKGRQKAKFMIWHHRYTYARRLSAWLMAPLDDFRRVGFLRPRSEFPYEPTR